MKSKWTISLELLLISFGFTIFVFTILVPKYKYAENQIKIEALGRMNQAAVGDGVQIMSISVDGNEINLLDIFNSSDWDYSNDRYTWARWIGCEDEIISTLSYRTISIKFLMNPYCGFANIYLNEKLLETKDFYSENEESYVLHLHNNSNMPFSIRIICIMVFGILVYRILTIITKRIVIRNKCKNSNRIAWLDILKGIGILMVIQGHGPTIHPKLSNLIWTIHMPLFFMATGFTLQGMDIKKQIHKDSKRILIPYIFGGIVLIISNIIAVLIKNKRIVDIVYIIKEGIGKIIYGSGGYTCSLFDGKVLFMAIGALWFLCALFISKLIFNAILQLDEKYWLLMVVGISIAGIGLTSILTERNGIWLPWSIQTGMTAVVFLYSGYIAKKEMWLEKRRRLFLTVSSLLIWGCIVLWGEGVFMVSNNYPLGMFGIIGAICGTICLTFLSQKIECKTVILSDFLRLCGENSLIILVFHLVELNYIPWDNIIAGLSTTNLVPGGIISLLIFVLKVSWCMICVIVVNRIPALKRIFKGKVKVIS